MSILPAPDTRWLPFLKLGFGYLLLAILGTLAAFIGLGKVEAQSSYGLDIILGGLLTLTGTFSSWAFKEPRPSSNPAEKPAT